MKQFNRTKKQSSLRPMTIKLGETKYEEKDLVDILESISFELININLSTKKTYIGLNGLGYAAVGFVNGFNPEDKTFKVVVFENRADAIEQLGDVVITARAFTDKRSGQITKIIGLDIEPVSAE